MNIVRKILMIILIIGSGLLWYSCSPEEDKTEIQIVNGPTTDLIAPTQVLIYWETDIPGNSIVDYGNTTDVDLTFTDDEERQFHNVLLSGLTAKIRYYYQVTSISLVIDAGASSELSEFMTGENEESITQNGWIWFAQNEMDSATFYFNQALSQNDEYGWAFIGLGWVQLRQGELLEALSNFNTGLTFDPTILDGRVGRAGINLSFNAYDNVISDGNYVLNTDGNYVFEYDETVDYRDVHIFLAQAYYAKGDFESVQAHCNILDPNNGLDPAMPSSWVVNGVTYGTYLEALLGLIQYLVLQHGGG
jgi:tetratricopeptide (TPR) repeat protein